MSEKLKSLLGHSLLVGIVCVLLGAGVTYWLTTQHKELSYIIEPADVILKNPSINKVVITVNDVPVKEVFSHRIKIWNSGNLPIKDVPFTFSFPIDKEDDFDFKILNLSFSTIPRIEFGKVEEEKKKELQWECVLDY